MAGNDEHFLRLAINLAWEARRAGADPFGAVLVHGDSVVAKDRDRSVEVSDPTYHAELSVISAYCRERDIFSLEGYTLYTSAEPCLMCVGAIHWARISRVVFSVSQAMLQAISGGNTKPGWESVLNSGGRRPEVVGPLLEDEGRAVFEGYERLPKLVRHAALFHPMQRPAETP
jgi:guanine deaminase